MTDTTAVQLVQDAYAAFRRGDIEAVMQAMHPEIEWHEAEHSPWHEPGGYRGPQAVVANVFARIPQAFENFAIEPEAIHNAGSTVIVEARYRGDAAGTGMVLDAQVCHVWTIRDGQIAGFQQYTDTWQFDQVTGSQTA